MATSNKRLNVKAPTRTLPLSSLAGQFSLSHGQVWPASPANCHTVTKTLTNHYWPCCL